MSTPWFLTPFDKAQAKQRGNRRERVLRSATYALGGVSLVAAIGIGLMSLVTPSGLNQKIGDLPAESLRTITWPLVWFIISVFVTAFCSIAAFLLEIHSHLDMVKEKLDENTPFIDALEPFRNIYHHYHLTKVGSCERWIYKRLDFSHRQLGGKLIATAPILPSSQVDRKNTIYQFEASLCGEDLVIHTHCLGYIPDLSVEVFHLGNRPPAGPFYSAKILKAMTEPSTLVNSIAILRRKPIDTLAKPGVVSDAAARQLQDEWDENSGIQRLPLVPAAASVGVCNNATISGWDPTRLFEVLRGITRCEQEEEDLRIVTTAFNRNAFPEDDLERLLLKDVRVKILVMDPQNEELVRARNEGRTDETASEMQAAIKAQIEVLNKLKTIPQTIEKCRGTLDVLPSDLLPFGFVLHTRHKAIIGLLLAHTSFSKGPMIEVERNAQPQLWDTLKVDWKARWDRAVAKSNSSPRHLG